jgi:hypothetical protein
MIRKGLRNPRNKLQRFYTKFEIRNVRMLVNVTEKTAAYFKVLV